MRDPSTQFQIGERVVYARDGIITSVSGYQWRESLGAPPTLVAYKLACGITVDEGAIKKYEAAEQGSGMFTNRPNFAGEFDPSARRS